MMGSRSARNMWSSILKVKLEIVHLVGLYYKNIITMHGPMNVKFKNTRKL